MNPQQVFILIPAYNEAKVIAQVIESLRGAGFSQIVVIDDCSSDETAAVARKSGARVIRHPINLGQGAALQTGFEFAKRQGAEFAVTFDADGQHCVEDIPTTIALLIKNDADIALGSRFLGQAPGMTRWRRYLLKLAILFTWLSSGLRLTDAHNGFRVLGARALALVQLRQNRMAHASEIIDWIPRAQLRYIEVPVTVRYTDYSKAKGQRASGVFGILLALFMGSFDDR